MSNTADVLPLSAAPTSANAPRKFYYCDCGHEFQAEITGVYDNWALHFACVANGCCRTWYACSICNKSRIKFYTTKQLSSHAHLQHTKKQKKTVHNKRPKLDSPPPPVASPVSHGDHDGMTVDFGDCESPPHRNETATDCILEFSTIRWERIHETNLGLTNRPSQKFFHACSLANDTNERGTAGLAYLVKQSQFQRDLNVSDLQNIYIPPRQLKLQMLIAKLAFRSGSENKELLAQVIDGVYEVGCEDGYFNAREAVNKNFNLAFNPRQFEEDYIKNKMLPPYSPMSVLQGAHKFGTRFPKRINDIRSMYLEYKHAIVPNLPHPRVRTDVPDHSYVSIVDCIRDFLAHQHARISLINNETFNNNLPSAVRHLSESRRAQQILENAQAAFGGSAEGKAVSYLIIWKDDCDPGATAMQGKANVHIMTLTIATLLGDGNRIQNTYPISIGKKGVSHEGVEKKITEDLLELRNGAKSSPFYVGSHNLQVNGYFELLANLGDQPEKRNSNYLQLGNGKYGARSLVSANHAELFGSLPSCGKCRQLLKERFQEGQWTLPIPTCQDCLNWDVLVDSELAYTPLPKNYPVRRNGEGFVNIPEGRLVEYQGELMLKPFELTYAGLRRAIDLAHDGYVEKQWTVLNMEAFLKVEGFNALAIDLIQEHAERAMSLRIADGHELDLLRQEQEKAPAAFQKWKTPALYQQPGVELATHLDVIMHLIALGMLKTSHKVIRESLKIKSKLPSFVRMNSVLLQELAKMNIDWLKINEYDGGKLQPWNSEHCLGFARIMPWFFQNISEAYSEIPAGSIPADNTPQSKWTKKQNQYWLRLRQLPLAGNATECSKRVADYMKQRPVPEIVPVANITPEEVQRLIMSMLEVAQCVMAPVVTDDLVQRTEYAIRIFLSDFNEMAEQLKIKIRNSETTSKSSTPTVVSSYNFSCLLNVPKAMRLFGPLRQLWEGGVRGEGYLPNVKRRYRGMQGKWHYNLLQGLLREKAFDNIMKETDNNLHVDHSFSQKMNGQYHKYSSPREVQMILGELNRKKKKPLSVLIILDALSVRLFLVVSDSETVVEIEMRIEDSKPTFGIDYYKFDMQQCDDAYLELDSVLTANSRLGFGMLMPLLDIEATEENRLYALVSSNWKWLSSANNLQDLVDDDA